MRTMFLGIVIAVTGAGCLAAPRAEYADESRGLSPTPVARAAYWDLAWLDDDVLALSRPDVDEGDAVVEIVAISTGEVLDTLTFHREGDCHHRQAKALTRTDEGRLLFVDVCTGNAGLDALTIHLREYDSLTRTLRDLGGLADQTWTIAAVRGVEEFYYEAGTELCATIFHKTPTSDGPTDLAVEIDGESVPLGEDILADQDRCTKWAQVTQPTVRDDGAFAAMVSPTHGVSGQGRIDLSASIVVSYGDTLRPLPWSIGYPGELKWLPDGDLLFTGSIGRVNGTWTTDGEALTLISDRAPWLAISPDGSMTAGLIHVHEINSIADLERAEEQGYEDELFLQDVVLLEL